MTIHPTAIVAGDALLGRESTVGAFAVIGVDGPDHATQLGEQSTVRSHVVIYRGTVIGSRFHAGHGALIREESVIGNGVSVGSHTIVEHHVRIADEVRIHGNAFIPEHSELERGCWIGPSVTITNARYPNRPDTKANLEGVIVREAAVIGAGAVLLPGVSVGHGAIVGGGAVVVENVAPGATVVGNPARRVR